jgi:peptide/nickel transport system substrate-binding protein
MNAGPNPLNPHRPPRRRTRRPGGVRAMLAVTVVALAVTACGAGAASTAGTNSTTLVVTSAGLPSTFAFDGAAPGGYENLEFGVNTQLGLVRHPYVEDAKSGGLVQSLYEYAPALAKSYDTSADGLTYTFHLAPDVKSFAGNPLTADDVVWSWQRKFKAETGVTKYIQDPVVTDPDMQVAKVDPMTVSFTVTKPGYGFTLLSLLANVTGYVYDSTLLKQHATGTDPFAVAWSLENPNIGFGAYQRSSFTPGTEMVLEANPNYPLKAPAYKKVIFRVSADPGTRANTVKRGDANIAVQLRASDQADMASAPGVKVYTFPSTNMITFLTMDTTRAPFDDVRVRQALELAVPYQQIVDNVYRGRAILTKGLLDPGAPNYSDSGLTAPKYDTAAAKALLAAAGHPDGVEFALTVSNSVPDVEQAAIQVQSFAAEGGFKISIDKQPAASVSEGITSRKFPAFMWRDMAISGSPQYELGLFYKEGDGGKAAATNSSGWVDDTYLATVDQGAALAEAMGQEAGVSWNAAEQITDKATPQILVARVQPQNAFRSNIKGVANRLDNDIDFAVLEPTNG